MLLFDHIGVLFMAYFCLLIDGDQDLPTRFERKRDEKDLFFLFMLHLKVIKSDPLPTSYSL